MDLDQLVRTRRTVHNYRPEKIDDRLVRDALELSLWAPNHKMTAPWRYVWLGAETRRKLAELSVELKSAKEPLTEIKAKATRDNVTTPSHLVALALKVSPSSTQMHEDYATLACSVQIASLWLWAKGVASKWSTGQWSLHPRAYDIVGLDPKLYRLEGCLMIGLPSVTPSAPTRPSLEDVLHITS